jgi:DNA (cytosine-5)-methyltransferase 1
VSRILEAGADLGWDVLPSGLVVPRELAKRLTAVDLFCGAGGFSLGILQAGFTVLAGVDNDENCLLTYLTNLGADRVDIRFVEPDDEERLERWMQKNVITRRKVKRGAEKELTLTAEEPVELYEVAHVSGENRHPEWGPPGWTGVPVYWFGDASKLSGERILESIGLERGELDLVVGGPPCQGFTFAGKRDVADPRNNLTFEFARLVTEMQPRTMVMENVPGILSMTTKDGALVVDEVCRILERGDFSEFEATRQLLTGEGRPVRRGTGTRKKSSTKKKPQGELDF